MPILKISKRMCLRTYGFRVFLWQLAYRGWSGKVTSELFDSVLNIPITMTSDDDLEFDLYGLDLYDVKDVVLNAAARLVTNTDKYDRGLSSILHDQLHWLNVPERIEYKVAVTVRLCLENKAPTYLSDYCIPVTAVSSRHLRSVNQHQLTVPRCPRITFGHRAFSVAGLMVWNSLPTGLRELSVGFGVF